MPGFDLTRDHVRVALRDVVLDIQLGLHPWERHPERPTRIVVNVEMFAYRANGQTPFIDYDRVRNVLKTWPKRPHTDLLETLLEELAALCFEEPLVAAVNLRIAKPDIFNEATAAEVSLYQSRP
jgi:dihydroneopterin aldolase